MLPEYHILSGLENPCRLLVTGGHLLVYYHDGNQKQLHFFFSDDNYIKGKLHIWFLFTLYFNLIHNFLIVLIWSLTFWCCVNLVSAVIV